MFVKIVLFVLSFFFVSNKKKTPEAKKIQTKKKKKMSWASVVRNAAGTPPMAPTNPTVSPKQSSTKASPELAPVPAAVTTTNTTNATTTTKSPSPPVVAANIQTPPIASTKSNSKENSSKRQASNTPPIAAAPVPAFRLTPVQPLAPSLRPAPLMLNLGPAAGVLSSSSSSFSTVAQKPATTATNIIPAFHQHQHPYQNAAGTTTTTPIYKLQYTRDQLKAIQQASSNARNGSDATLIAATTEVVASRVPVIVSDVAYDIHAREQRRREQFSFECSTCSVFDITNTNSDESASSVYNPTTGTILVKPPPAGACTQMSELIRNSLKASRSNGLTFLAQNPDVVFGQIRMSIVFDAQRGAPKFRGGKIPANVIERIRTFVCGEGFHFPVPAQKDDAIWLKFTSALKFDLILENQAPLFAELGKFWKRTHSPFQKFVHLLFWRDELPPARNKNMIGHYQMPVVVACTAGDVDAAILLMHLRFHVLQDDFLWNFPFMKNLEPIKHAVLRHVCRYFYRKQTERVIAASGMPVRF